MSSVGRHDFVINQVLNRIWHAIQDISSGLILYLIHLCYILWLSGRALTSYLSGYWRFTDASHEQIEKDKARLSKIPHHLAIVVSREMAAERSQQDWQNIMHDLCRLSCWAWEFGVQEVSVYEATGILKSMSVEFYKQQSVKLHYWMKDAKTEKREPLRFSVLSDDDGRNQLARVAKHMAGSAIDKNLDTSTINVETVDQWVHNATRPDPELMIVYGGLPHQYVSLDGYPPWHIRLTEFVNISQHHRLTYSLFANCLYRFSRVEQRFGI